ncbi:YveK family protein [Listeria aquatica]|uniref:YveK family protein n=1 Tax=Listeria aquatica TaxID=1494960 RepID=UPI003F71DCAF
MQDTIDFTKICAIANKMKFKIALIFIVIVSCMSVYLWFIATPVYQSEVQLLVNQTERNANIQDQEVQANLKLVETYSTIIMSPRILDIVKQNLKGKYSKEDLSDTVNVKNNANSQVLTITARDTDSKEATEIANQTAKVFKREIPKIMKVNNVTILTNAGVTTQNAEVKPNRPLMLMLSLIVGVLVSLIVITIKAINDKTIQTEQELQMEFGQTMLGTIEDFSKIKIQ